MKYFVVLVCNGVCLEDCTGIIDIRGNVSVNGTTIGWCTCDSGDYHAEIKTIKGQVTAMLGGKIASKKDNQTNWTCTCTCK